MITIIFVLFINIKAYSNDSTYVLEIKLLVNIHMYNLQRKEIDQMFTWQYQGGLGHLQNSHK